MKKDAEETARKPITDSELEYLKCYAGDLRKELHLVNRLIKDKKGRECDVEHCRKAHFTIVSHLIFSDYDKKDIE